MVWPRDTRLDPHTAKENYLDTKQEKYLWRRVDTHRDVGHVAGVVVRGVLHGLDPPVRQLHGVATRHYLQPAFCEKICKI